MLGRALAIIALGALPAVAVAQEDSAPAPPEPAAAPAAEAPAQAPAADADDPAPADTQQAGRNSPYDYEPSEAISEDRSVSFPVDI